MNTRQRERSSARSALRSGMNRIPRIAAFLVAIALQGCGADDSGSGWVAPEDSGDLPEAGKDAVAEAAPPADSGPEASGPESSLEASTEDVAEVGPSCSPKTCAQMEYTCGKAPDGCGGVIECGACSTGQLCGGGGGPNKCGPNPCYPRSCAQMGSSCGISSDGCADVMDCGGCAAPASCGGAGKANECGCTAKSCAQMGLTCGEAPDGCGGVIDCGKCESGQTCGGAGANKCGSDACAPKTCAQLGVSCGVVSNGCGATLDCGACKAPEVCGGGGEANFCGCLPKTCPQLGYVCGEVDDGCGKKLQCGVCDDKNACTFGDTCKDGECIPGAEVKCSSPPEPSCHEPVGACDKTTGNCEYPHSGAGTPCDLDANLCTADTCDGLGTCQPTAAPPCTTPPDPGCYEAVGTCNPADGKCVYQPKAAGTGCDADGNACTTGDACDGNGLCVAGALKTCSSPPNAQCFDAAGTCDPSTGACNYNPKAGGTACNADSNACTVNDACNATGTCVAGATKTCTTPPNATCYNATGTCNTSDGSCSYTPKANGTSCGTCKECQGGTCSNVSNGTACGANVCFYCSSGSCTARPLGYQYDGTESHRCCGSTRTPVDISTSETHCGGCGLGCASGETCQSVSATTSCSPHPASTTGRCTCDSNSECPKGRNGANQTCRTSTPYAGVCAPSTAEYCATGESFQNVSSCPNYCYYP